MKITFEEFQKQSRRTMPYGGRPAKLQEQNDILLNYSLGLVGEALELEVAVNDFNGAANINTEAEVLKKIGDVMHYASGLCDIHGLVLGEAPTGALQGELSVTHLAGRVAEYTKKHVFHGHEEPFPSDNIRLIVDVLSREVGRMGTSIEEVMAMNIQKLKERFPIGFNTQDSVARVDEENVGQL